MNVDLIIKSKWIAPVDSKETLIKDHAIVINDKKIVALCPHQEAADKFITTNTIELDNHILIPGLINAHCHAPMTLLRGIADDLPLEDWLNKKIWPLEEKFISQEFVEDGAELAIAEMILSGTTCFADMYFYPDCVAKKAIDSNMRVQLACPVLDFPTIWAQSADEYIQKTITIHDNYRNSELISVAFGPHAPYTVSDAPLKKIGALAEELDIPIHMHVHETEKEISDSMKEFGCRPLRRLSNLRLVSPRLNCVHATQLTEGEIELIAESGSNIVHCPASNMKLASGICNVSHLIKNDTNVCLGTDGAASNNELDLLKEARLASLLTKISSQDASSLPAHKTLEVMTINGARALGLEASIGSLEVGKLADITAISFEAVNTMPVNNPLSQVVYSANSTQVTHVWIGGRMVLRDRCLETMDLTAIKDKAKCWQHRFEQG